MSAIKNFYFDEINNSVNNNDDFDYQYQKWLENEQSKLNEKTASSISEDAAVSCKK